MSKVLIRPAKYSDLPHMMRVNMTNLPENYDAKFWIDIYNEAEGRRHSFVATYATEVIGYIFCDKESVISFAIDEEYRRGGIGKQLMCHSLNSFTVPVHLHVKIDNEPAINLYKGVGFTEKAIIKQYYSETEDAYELEWKPTKTKFQEIRKIKKPM